MSNWKYTIYGNNLRDAIYAGQSTGQCLATLKELKICYKAIQRQIDELDWENYFEWAYENVIDDITLLEDSAGEYIPCGFGDAVSLVDDRLMTFYDLCDDYRIWITT